MDIVLPITTAFGRKTPELQAAADGDGYLAFLQMARNPALIMQGSGHNGPHFQATRYVVVVGPGRN